MRMLQDNTEFKDTTELTGSHIVFADSSHCDAGEGRSTACELQVYQGGIIDHTSWVPEPVSLSTAESENNCYSVAIMKAIYISRVLNYIRGRGDALPPTIPICVDNAAAITFNQSENITRRVRHIESRFWFGRSAVQSGRAKFIKVDGKTEQPADLGTKNIQENDARKYLDLFEAPYYT